MRRRPTIARWLTAQGLSAPQIFAEDTEGGFLLIEYLVDRLYAREMAQDALNRFWWPSLMMFGPKDGDSAHSSQSMAWKIKRQSNDELRQSFIDQTVPQIEILGLDYPDPEIKWNEERGHYDSGELDWDEFYRVIKGNGPCNYQRIKHHKQAHDEGEWVREAVRSYREKHLTSHDEAA